MRFPQPATLALALLLTAATAMPTWPWQGADIPQLVRAATPEDVQNDFRLLESGGKSPNCPNQIRHTTWQEDAAAGMIILPHNTIIQDGNRCSSIEDEKRLEFYNSAEYSDDWIGGPGAPPIPDGLRTVIGNSGLNIDTLDANFKSGTDFLIGYEGKPRFCGDGPSVFPNLTTAFVMRPISELSIKRLESILVPDSVYLLMVPAYLGTYCLYGAMSNPAALSVEVSPLPAESEAPMIAESTESVETTDASEEPIPSIMVTTNNASDSVPIMPSPPAADESAEASPDNDGVCFSADGLVVLRNGDVKRMADVQLGDMVRSGVNSYTRVFSFTHRDAKVLSRFLRLRTECGHVLTVTPRHFVYACGGVRAAHDVRIGDRLHLGDGSVCTVVNVSQVMLEGLYNPQTADGNIVVDGVLATTFTADVRPAFAHAALAPIRAVYSCLGADPLQFMLRLGLRRLLAFVPKGSLIGL